jgi:FkbM family methyltransferase
MSGLYTFGRKVYESLPPVMQDLAQTVLHGAIYKYSVSYSQTGEDCIIKFLSKGVPFTSEATWLDIGAHHPVMISNTAMFYKMGLHGINVEANPELIKAFYRKRPRDINLNIAIADKTGTMDFYIMDGAVLHTLSKEEAYRYESLGAKIKKIIPVKTMTVADLIDTYCKGVFPDFLTLDAEGYDLEIIKTVPWDRASPKIICVENVPFNPKLKNYFESMQKSDISVYLKGKGYSIIAFTLINTIFVRNDCVETE